MLNVKGSETTPPRAVLLHLKPSRSKASPNPDPPNPRGIPHVSARSRPPEGVQDVFPSAVAPPFDRPSVGPRGSPASSKHLLSSKRATSNGSMVRLYFEHIWEHMCVCMYVCIYVYIYIYIYKYTDIICLKM